jgi:hypothetical protein
MAAKRQRKEVATAAVQHLLHIGGLSNKGLQKLLQELRSLPECPDIVNKHVMDAAFHSRCQLDQ